MQEYEKQPKQLLDTSLPDELLQNLILPETAEYRKLLGLLESEIRAFEGLIKKSPRPWEDKDFVADAISLMQLSYTAAFVTLGEINTQISVEDYERHYICFTLWACNRIYKWLRYYVHWNNETQCANTYLNPPEPHVDAFYESGTSFYMCRQLYNHYCMLIQLRIDKGILPYQCVSKYIQQDTLK